MLAESDNEISVHRLRGAVGLNNYSTARYVLHLSDELLGIEGVYDTILSDKAFGCLDHFGTLLLFS